MWKTQLFLLPLMLLVLCRLSLTADVLVFSETQTSMSSWHLLTQELGIDLNTPSWEYYRNISKLNVDAISNKLWENVEKQLLELQRKQQNLNNRFNACKRILRVEELNTQKFSELDDRNVMDPYGYNSMESMKQDLSILKAFQNQLKSLRVSTEDKNDITRGIVNSLNKSLRCNLPLPNFDVTEACTPDSTKYIFYPFNGTENEFYFAVAAKNDVHLALTTGPRVDGNMFEFVIGGWGNTKSVIRLDHNKDVVEAATKNVVDTCEFRSFWVRWNNNGIQLGNEGDMHPFLQYNKGPTYPVNFIGIHTGFGSSGNWVLKN